MNLTKAFIVTVLSILALSFRSVHQGGMGADAPKKPPAVKSPLSPQEALKHFKITPGLRIELVAAEPQMESPVAMTFDEEADADAAKR